MSPFCFSTPCNLANTYGLILRNANDRRNKSEATFRLRYASAISNRQSALLLWTFWLHRPFLCITPTIFLCYFSVKRTAHYCPIFQKPLQNPLVRCFQVYNQKKHFVVFSPTRRLSPMMAKSIYKVLVRQESGPVLHGRMHVPSSCG